MTIARPHLTTAADAVGAASYTTASITPTANRLVLAWVQCAKSTTPNILLSGNGLTWVEVATVVYATSRRLTLFRAMSASPSTGAVTITFEGDVSVNSCGWSIFELDNVDTSGSNGSGALVQSNTNSAAAVTSLTVTLAAFGSANNVAVGGFGSDSAQTITEGSGFTIAGQASASTVITIGSEGQPTNDTSIDISIGSSNDLAGIAAEVKEATAAAGFAHSRGVIVG